MYKKYKSKKKFTKKYLFVRAAGHNKQRLSSVLFSARKKDTSCSLVCRLFFYGQNW